MDPYSQGYYPPQNPPYGGAAASSAGFPAQQEPVPVQTTQPGAYPYPGYGVTPPQPYQPPYQPYGSYPDMIPYNMYSPVSESARTKGIVSMILGIISLVFIFASFSSFYPSILALGLGITAVVLGSGAKKQLFPGMPGYAAAQAGFITGIICLSICALFLLALLFLVAVFSF